MVGTEATEPPTPINIDRPEHANGPAGYDGGQLSARQRSGKASLSS